MAHGRASNIPSPSSSFRRRDDGDAIALRGYSEACDVSQTECPEIRDRGPGRITRPPLIQEGVRRDQRGPVRIHATYGSLVPEGGVVTFSIRADVDVEVLRSRLMVSVAVEPFADVRSR